MAVQCRGQCCSLVAHWLLVPGDHGLNPLPFLCCDRMINVYLWIKCTFECISSSTFESGFKLTFMHLCCGYLHMFTIGWERITANAWGLYRKPSEEDPASCNLNCDKYFYSDDRYSIPRRDSNPPWQSVPPTWIRKRALYHQATTAGWQGLLSVKQIRLVILFSNSNNF